MKNTRFQPQNDWSWSRRTEKTLYLSSSASPSFFHFARARVTAGNESFPVKGGQKYLWGRLLCREKSKACGLFNPLCTLILLVLSTTFQLKATVFTACSSCHLLYTDCYKNNRRNGRKRESIPTTTSHYSLELRKRKWIVIDMIEFSSLD